jgi:hypothetical protein
MESHAKKNSFCDTDLALAVTMPLPQQRRFIQKVTSGTGHDFYRSARATYPVALNVDSLPLHPSIATLRRIISRKCKKARPGQVRANQAIVEGLGRYRETHNVSGAWFQYDPVNLGRAGYRTLWAPFQLQIDGKKCIPYFDLRSTTPLTYDARRFIFSVNHAHIREQDPALYGDARLVIFQFDTLRNGARKVIPHFDDGIKFWTAEEIGAMIDAAYRVLDEINNSRAA